MEGGVTYLRVRALRGWGCFVRNPNSSLEKKQKHMQLSCTITGKKKIVSEVGQKQLVKKKIVWRQNLWIKYKPWVGLLKADPISELVSVLAVLGDGEVWIVNGVVYSLAAFPPRRILAQKKKIVFVPTGIHFKPVKILYLFSKDIFGLVSETSPFPVKLIR